MQEEAGKDINYFQQYLIGLQFRQMFDPNCTDEEIEKEIQELLNEHPEIDPETKELIKTSQKTYQINELSNKFKSIDIPEIFEKTGFKGIDSVIVNYDEVMNGVDSLLNSSNLNAWKINALIKLGISLGAFSNEEEQAQLGNFDVLSFIAMMDAERTLREKMILT